MVGSAVGRSRAVFWRRVDVARQRHLRRRRGHRADRVADHEFAPDQGDVAHHGVGGVEHLAQAGPRPAAQGGERVGQPRAGDQVVGRRSEAGAPQQAGDLHEEAPDSRRTGIREHVAVPAGARHAGRVARRRAQPPVRPWHPRRGDLHLGEPAERRRVVGGGRHPLMPLPLPGNSPVTVRLALGPLRISEGGEGGDVPGTADDDDRARRLLGRGADRTAHVRLALEFAAGGDEAGTDGAHGVGDGVERGRAVAAVFDHVLPPAFGVRVARGRGEVAERVGRGLPADEFVVIRRGGERHGERQVDRPHRHVVLVRPGDRLPLGAEHGERRERRPRRIGDDVPEQGDRRHEFGIADPLQRRFEVGRQLDEDHRRLHRIERLHHGAGRSGAVVPHAEQVHLGTCDVGRHVPSLTRRGRGRRRRSRPTRRGRGRPSRGTPARRPSRGRGR